MIAGAGRMGQSLASTVEECGDLALQGVWRRGDDIGALLDGADVVIDFSPPEGTGRVLAAAVARHTPMVCGVSGLDDEQFGQLRESARQIPIVFDRNMSLGVAVLERSVREAAASLGGGFSAHISEVHHIHKKDAPSGTALKLGEAIAAARGDTGLENIEFESERRGDVPGDHRVTLRSTTETLTFSHSVTTRQVFVDGAIRAARWVIGRAPGRYSMQDVLFGDPNRGIQPK